MRFSPQIHVSAYKPASSRGDNGIFGHCRSPAKVANLTDVVNLRVEAQRRCACHAMRVAHAALDFVLGRGHKERPTMLMEPQNFERLTSVSGGLRLQAVGKADGI